MSVAVQGQINKETAQDVFRKKFKKAVHPDDFEGDLSFLRYAVKLFDDDLEADRGNREVGMEAARFMVGDQWDEEVKQSRQVLNKPTMTFNRLVAFVGQVVGNRRLNEVDIKVVPDDAAYKPTAKIREGLIRSIQKNSRANRAYNKAHENQVITGIGNFEVVLKYAHDDVFEQDAVVKSIKNAFAVVWDACIEDPTGADAKHVFVVDTMTIEDFKREYPDALAADLTINQHLISGYTFDGDWITREHVRVVRMWRMRTRKAIVALLRDGDSEDVVDVTDKDPKDFIDRVVTNSEGMPVMREVDRKYAQLYHITALDILEGPYEIPVSRVPVFRVPGWDISVGDFQKRFGLLTFLLDPQKLFNYWRSVIAEKLMRSPKGNWIASADVVQGREQEWRDSHISDDPLLLYNADAGSAPIQIKATQLEPALIEQAGMAAQDLRDISNLHQASLGQKSNEVSGKAILTRQRIGEVGTIIYQDNLDMAIEECGRVLNELIPFVYDTSRTIKVLGEEGEELDPVVINDTTNEASVDITAGKYSVSSTVGPSTVTKRVEASEGMLNMVNANPQALAVAFDKIVEAQDWPGASEIARRLRLQLPAGILNESDMTDRQKEDALNSINQAEIDQQKADTMFQAELDEKTSRARQAEALAIQAEAKAVSILETIDIDKFNALANAGDVRAKRVLEAAKLFEEITSES